MEAARGNIAAMQREHAHTLESSPKYSSLAPLPPPDRERVSFVVCTTARKLRKNLLGLGHSCVFVTHGDSEVSPSNFVDFIYCEQKK